MKKPSVKETLIFVLIFLFTLSGKTVSAQYCVDGGPSETFDGNVQQVTINGDGTSSINYTSSCPGYAGVEDLTSQSVDVTAGNSYTLYVTFGTCDNSNSGAGEIWIDFDENHSFESSESIGQSSGTPGTAPWNAAVAFTFTVPADASNGPSRMRIMQQDWGNTPMNACGSFYSGSVMDFGINISGGQDICNMPSNQNETSITTTGATLNWTEDGSSTQWEVEYGLSGFTQGNGTTVTVNTTPSYTLSGLSSGTDYSWYVRAICSGGGKSYWEGPHDFMTNCAVQNAPFSENFDAVSSPDLPNCWSKKVVKSDSFYFGLKVETQGWDANSNPNSVVLDASDDPAATLLLITPHLGDLTSQSNQIRFYGFSWSLIDVVVGTMSDPTDETTFTPYQTITLTDTYTEYTVTFGSSYTGTDEYIAFKHSGGAHTSLNIDDFVYEAIPTCPAPTGQASNNATSTTVDLDWTENGSASTWNIEYGATGFTQGSGTMITATSKPYHLTGLSIGTTYDWYVRTDCGGGDQSSWTGPDNFTTSCAALTASYSQNFDQVTAPDLPNCWSAALVQGASAFVNTVTTGNPHSAPNHAYLYNGSATSGNILLISPQFSDLTSHSNQIRFYAYADNTADLIIGTMSDPTDQSTFTAFQTVELTGTYTEYSIVFGTNYTLTDQYIAFRHGLNTIHTTIYIDDFVYEPAPACPPPANQTETGIALNSSDLSWDETGTATQWNIEYGAKGYTQGSGTTVSGITNPYTLSGLIANNQYDWYVQADCGANGTSSWTGSSTFTTATGKAENPTPEDGIKHIAITSTTFDWDDVTNADSYTIDIGTTYEGDEIVSAESCASSQYTLSSNLDYSTVYYWKVSTIYNSGANSVSGDVWQFTTECTPQTVPYSENFDAVTAPDMPECWNTIINTTNFASIITVNQGSGVPSAPNVVRMYNTSDANATIIMVTPRLSDLPTQTNQIRFYTLCNDEINLIVGTMSDPNDETTFTPYDTLFFHNNSSSWEEYTILFGSAYTLTDEYIAFKSTATPWAFIYFDSFVYETMPTCSEPNFLSEDNITLNSSELSWAANGASTWNIKYGTSGFDPSTAGTTVSGITGYPYTLGNTLDPSTTYDWYIQADCGSGTTSNWSEVSTFTTDDGKAENPVPANNATGISLTDNFVDWDDVEHAEGYYLDMGTTSGGTDIANHEYLGNSGYTHTSDWEYGKTYYWTVTTIHNGTETVTGDEWGFEAETGTHLLPVTEDFESGFDKFDNNYGNGTYWSITSTLQHGGTKSAHNAYGSNQNNVLVETGIFDLTGTNSPTLSFWHIAKTEGGNYDKCYVEISTDGGQNYNPLPASAYSGSGTNYPSDGYFDETDYPAWGTGSETPDNTWWREETFNLDSYKTSNLRIRFRLQSDGGVEKAGWYIDDIVINQQESCSKPSSQFTDNITETTARLNWTENGSATEWTVEYGEQGFQLGNGTRNTATANPHSISALTGETDYSWYVRSKCPDGTYTNWTGTDDFTTPFAPNTVSSFPYTESFESGLGLWRQMNSDNIDWTRNSGPTPSQGTGPDNASDGTYYLYTEASGNTGKYAGLIIAFDFTSLTSPQLNFDYHMYGADMGHLYVDISTDNGANWSHVWHQSGNQGNQWMSDLVNLHGYGGTSSLYLRFWARTGQGYRSDISIDNIDVDEAPACPKPNNLAENNVTSTAADLSWTENGNTTLWDIELDTMGFTPTGTPTVSQTQNNPHSYTLPDDAAKYQWYVRSDCGGSSYSEWTGPHTFVTPPENDECADAIEITGANMETWVNASNVGATTSNAPWPHCAGTGTEDVWFTAVYPATGSYLVITTSQISGSAFYDGGMEVYSGSCGNFSYVACDDDSSPYGQNMPQVTINDASLAGQTLFVRVWHRGDYYGKFQIMARVSPLEAVWDGSEGDNDWYNAANWDINDIPGAITEATIPAGLTSYPTITYKSSPDNAKCKTLLIESNSTSDASILGDDNLTVSGYTTVERYLTGGKWHEVSAMINGATVNSFYFSGTPEVWMNEYVESTDGRSPVTALGTSMPLGKGFEAWVETGNNATAEFKGNLNTNTVYLSTSSTPALKFTDASHGYNLLGNPFASPIKWGYGSWSLSNVENNVWVWDPQNNNYACYSGGTGCGNLTNGIIPMGQAFFVHTTASNPSLTIPENSRVHSTQAFYSAGRDQLPDHIIINVNKDDVKDEVWVVFSENATNGHNFGYDVEKMKGAETSPQLYLAENNRLYSIDVLSPLEAGETYTVPLNFKAGDNGVQTLTTEDMDMLNGITVTIEDLRTNTTQVLNDNPVYSFNAVTYQSPERFLLHFNRSVNGMFEKGDNENISVYAYEKHIYVNCSGSAVNYVKTITVYDLLGQKVLEKTVNPGNLVKIPVTLKNSYVLVKVVSNNKVITKKVFIK